MGIVNKVILVFPRIFWPLNLTKFGQIQEPNTTATHDDFENNRGKYYMFQNMYQETLLPCLVVYISGQACIKVEKQTDESIVNDILDRLSNMFPDETPLPRPIETVTTRWSQDCYSKGCATILKPNGSHKEFFDAAKDVKMLYLAGEHVSRNNPGTVSGNVG